MLECSGNASYHAHMTNERGNAARIVSGWVVTSTPRAGSGWSEQHASDTPIGPNVSQLGGKITYTRERLPIDSYPYVDENMRNTISRLYMERTLPGANVSLIDHKIRCLVQARSSLELGAGGLLTADNNLLDYIETALIEASTERSPRRTEQPVLMHGVLTNTVQLYEYSTNYLGGTDSSSATTALQGLAYAVQHFTNANHFVMAANEHGI